MTSKESKEGLGSAGIKSESNDEPASMWVEGEEEEEEEEKVETLTDILANRETCFDIDTVVYHARTCTAEEMKTLWAAWKRQRDYRPKSEAEEKCAFSAFQSGCGHGPYGSDGAPFYSDLGDMMALEWKQECGTFCNSCLEFRGYNEECTHPHSWYTPDNPADAYTEHSDWCECGGPKGNSSAHPIDLTE